MGGLWRGINGVAQRLPGDNEKRGRVMGGGKNNQELMDYFPFYPLFFIINLFFLGGHGFSTGNSCVQNWIPVDFFFVRLFLLEIITDSINRKDKNNKNCVLGLLSSSLHF